MKDIIRNLLNEIRADRQRRRRVRSLLLALSLLVAAGVIWQLRITGITMTGEALCGQLEHMHTTSCMGLVNVCGLEESEEHQHQGTCWQEGYICGYTQEHQHTPLCYSNAEADLESSSDWESTLPEMTQNPAADLVAVARSQLGYAESEQNYHVADDGITKMGYTRYGEWYGNPYGDWSTMFASFCLRYAEHPAYEVLKNSGAESMRLAAENAGVYYAASAAVPGEGDLAFLDKDGNGRCETVAIVAGCSENSVSVIEGDCDGAVAENQYALDHSAMLGYALLRAPTATLETDDITIRFVIDNPVYTNDNGNTHVTVNLTEKNNPAGDGFSTTDGFQYTYWTKDNGKFKHKITGAGTLMTCSIPAGTTLADSGYSLPNIGITNMSGSQNSYVGSRSWVTDGGMICNANTVFAEDTTLRLSLYPSDSVYTLNWVCNCTGEDAMAGSHSVYFNLTSKYPSASFAPGESLASNYILSAEDVNSTYTGSATCNVGSAHNKVFTGWYLKDQSGNEVPFGAGVPLLEDYAQDKTIKVYARWEAAESAAEVTATFINGETKTTATLPSGAQLGENLPAVTAPEGMVFRGWRIGDTEEFATAETVITEDTTFYAVFEKEPGDGTEEEGCSVYLHDIAPDGVTDYEAEGQDIQVSQTYLDPGMTLAEALEEDPYSMMHDGALASDCIWYVKQAENYVPYSLTAPITDPELHLYTFSYEVKLTKQDATAAMAKSVNVEVNGNTLTLTLREGEKPNASDFVINGVDYTLYEWTDSASGEPLNIHQIIEQGVDQNITASSTGMMSGLQMQQISVNFYVARDGRWVKVQSDTLNSVHSNGRYHISAAQLEAAYQDYGFTAASLNSTDNRRFAHVDVGGGNIWSCEPTQLGADGYWFIPGLNHGGTCDVYYLPMNTTTMKGERRDGFLNANMFYTVSVEDPENLVYEAGEALPEAQFVLTGNDATVTVRTIDQTNITVENGEYYWAANDIELTNGADNADGTTTFMIANVTEPIVVAPKRNVVTIRVEDDKHLIYSAEALPAQQQVIKGETAQITVLTPEGYGWLANGKAIPNGSFTSDGTQVTYTFQNLTEDITLSPVKLLDSVKISYNINLLGEPTSAKPTIKDSETYQDTYTGGNYVVLTPSKTQYTLSGSSALNTVVFHGWKIAGTNTILTEGTLLTPAEISQYGAEISLEAVWEQLDITHTVSFYINLELQVASYDNSTTHTPNENYTSALYGTEVHIEDCPQCDEDRGFESTDVITGESASATAATDAEIRKLVNGVTATYMGKERLFTLGTFPDDALMLQKIVAEQEKMIADFEKSTYYNPKDPTNVTSYRAIGTTDGNGVFHPTYRIICTAGTDGQLRYVPAEELTTENYTIRWYVFKYEGTNGWHVDGVLVKKQAQLTVTKTFYGDADAVAEVKETYAIDVVGINEENPTSNEGRPTLYTLTLEAEDTQENDPATPQKEQGYRDYDPATDTYTWVVNLTADWKAWLYERNYMYSDNEIVTLPEYLTYNFTDKTYNQDRKTYENGEGVCVAVKAHSVDQDYRTFETVSFYNAYLPSAAVPISKVDDTGKPLTGVSFYLNVDANGITDRAEIRKDADGIYYIYNPKDIETELVDTGYITVDEMGYALVMGLKDKGLNYSFELVEATAPEGYTSIGVPIKFHIDDNGIQLTENSAATTPDHHTIHVTNTSQTMSVTAIKNWMDETNKKVTLQLMLDDTPLPGKVAELDGTVDSPAAGVTDGYESEPWTVTWNNLPAYTSGTKAVYTIKETWIDGISYNSTYGDGYADYQVVVKDMEYTDYNGEIPTAAKIEVTNRKQLSGLEFTKTNELGEVLAGAEFQLYLDPGCKTAYGSPQTSDSSGTVSFGDLAAGTYYMKEIQAPEGYLLPDTVYTITVFAGKTTITVYGTTTTLTQIINDSKPAQLHVKKVDEAGSALSGAQFEVWKQDSIDGNYYRISRTIDGEERTQFAVNEQGELVVPDLTRGSYKLVEASAPDGYYRMTEEIHFTVEKGEILCGSNSELWSFNGTAITVVNVAGTELPKSGGMGTQFGTMAGLLIMAGSLICGFLMRRKRRRGCV